MKNFAGKIAVITGGGAGMGRELARLLCAEGCDVAICDISAQAVEETKLLCETDRPKPRGRVVTQIVDVALEDHLIAFRETIIREFQTDHIHLLFNNAGIGGGESLIKHSREVWERTFNVDWFGVYFGTRTFLPLLLKAPEGHIINTSSMYGFWAAAAVGVPQSAYCTAKFAVKGFTEAMIEDFRANAPHIKCSVVMPGHIGTRIWANTAGRTLGSENPTDRAFVEQAPTSAADAAKIILDGVRAGHWRILVGPDAHAADEAIRADPERAYEPETFQKYGVRFLLDIVGQS